MFEWNNIVEGNALPLMLVGMMVVFSALVLLVVLMKLQHVIHVYFHRKRQVKETPTETPTDTQEDIAGVEIAAIALTVILEEESVHDEESMVLTLRALPRPYSNWWMREWERPWKSQTSKGRPSVMSAADPIQGKRV